ncbi:MAG: hypothetical protein K0Q43_15 [Ramlibacter sp.]|nr:hypothetical protein [Ramlibacter sp.]
MQLARASGLEMLKAIRTPDGSTMPLEWARRYREALLNVIDADSGIDPEADWLHLAQTYWAALPEDKRILRLSQPELGEEDGRTDADGLLDTCSGDAS